MSASSEPSKNQAESFTFRSRAPLRISFGGGGTDVLPYWKKHGGMVLGATIDKYAYCSVSSGPESGFLLDSQDLELTEYYEDLRSLSYDGKFDLVKAALKTLAVHGNSGRLRLSLLSEAPPGSGLGSSSSLMVSIIKAVADYYGSTLSSYALAELAYKLEREELKIKGGFQDQYLATFGGFNFVEFSKRGITVNPLRLRDEIIAELRAGLVLVDTGKSRPSSNILSRQIQAYEREDGDVMENLSKIKDITMEMKSSLLRGDLIRFGSLLGEEWECKKHLDAGITNPEIDSIFSQILEKGAIGGKIIGAGGGGHMIFWVDFARKREVMKFLLSRGLTPVSFGFERNGVVSWKLGKGGVVFA